MMVLLVGRRATGSNPFDLEAHIDCAGPLKDEDPGELVALFQWW